MKAADTELNLDDGGAHSLKMLFIVQKNSRKAKNSIFTGYF